MYGILTYIWLIFMVNVGKYTIHGWYGLWWQGVVIVVLLCYPSGVLGEMKKYSVRIFRYGRLFSCFREVFQNKTFHAQSLGEFIFLDLGR